jgi:hypothetical protein
MRSSTAAESKLRLFLVAAFMKKNFSVASFMNKAFAVA